MATGRAADLIDKGEKSSGRQGKQGHGGTADSMAAERSQVKASNFDS